ncbi:putative ATP/GTP-binding protein [Desulfosporosinus sp. BG]|nr:putative ATP/GTP-binding protein [Desulfosporosinus sp. BG]
MEFDYVGVIIGRDLRYENGRVITDSKARARSDQSLRGIGKRNEPNLADRIIRNTYKTLLTRGQKGCYIYCEDKALYDYLAGRIPKVITEGRDQILQGEAGLQKAWTTI